MYVRLAFAVAAHLEPEILIVDEVLAVGDAAFQKKCLGKMGEVAAAGRTVLFVSHNMAIIQKLCSRAVLLRQGRMVALGRARQVVIDYLAQGATESNFAVIEGSDHPNRLPCMRRIAKTVSLLGADGEPKTDFTQGEALILRIEYDATKFGINLAGAGFILETDDGLRVGAFNSYMGSKPPHRLPPKGKVEFLVKKPYLTPADIA